MANTVNNPSGGSVDGGGARPFDWGSISKDILNNQGFPDQSNVSRTPVLCKDGTTKIQNSSPNAKYMDACMDNGGRAENQTVQSLAVTENQPLGYLQPQAEPISDLKYYTSANFLKRASVSIVPVGLIGVYCYKKKFSLLKSALLVSIPILAITGLQYLFMGGGKNSYWGIFTPPSTKANYNAQLREIEQKTGMPQKGYK